MPGLFLFILLPTFSNSINRQSTLDGAQLPIGDNVITWTATQNVGGIDYQSQCSFTVTVKDDISPVISPEPQDLTLSITPGTCGRYYTLPALSVTDNCTATVSLTITNNAPDPFLIGTTIVRWEVTDQSNNSTVYFQDVTVVDDEGPVISNCPSSNVVVAASGSACDAVATWPPLTATDACSGVGTFTSTHSSGQTFPVGITPVTYYATDNDMNTTSCTFNVQVNDTPPTITCVGNQTRETNPGTCRR